jgi:S1-C subfamily serine protease
MNIKLYYFMYVISILSAIAFFGRLGYLYYNEDYVEDKAMPVLMAYSEDQSSRSSAVYIGNGYFLTAAHILSSNQSELVMETNIGQKLVAELLWASTSYDISLFHSEHYDSVYISSYSIDCSALSIGDELQFIGNPTNIDFVNTWGRVARDEIEIPNMWKRAIPVNATILPGMSGGAVIDDRGKLKGINVGTLRAVSGMSPMGPQASFTGISYIVESADICFLMGKQ